MTASTSISQSNQGNYDLHLALHSNAAPVGEAGKRRGAEVYYYPSSREGRRAADIIAVNLQKIYPLPEKVITVPTTYLGEVAKTRAPGILIEFAYHDNVDDAEWIQNNIQPIAINVVESLCIFFGIPFVRPDISRPGTVSVRSGWLNIRANPSMSAPIVARAWNDNPIEVLGSVGNDWYKVNYYGRNGYAKREFIVVRPR